MISDLMQLLCPSSNFVSEIETWIEGIITDYPQITNLDLGASLIPWDNIISATVLCVFLVSLFKFMRTILTRNV